MDLLAAIEENGESLYRRMGDAITGGWYRRDEHYRAMMTDPSISYFNGIAMFRATAETADNYIDRAINEMRELDVPWRWQVGPQCTPYDLKDRLIDHGLSLNFTTPGMVARVDRTMKFNDTPKDLEVRRVSNDKELDDWSDACCQGFGMPPVAGEMIACLFRGKPYLPTDATVCYSGYCDGQVVSTSLVDFACEVAGVYCVATLEGARGKGYGAAVTAACMKEAVSRQVPDVILHSSKMGRPVYEKLGFREVCEIAFFS